MGPESKQSGIFVDRQVELLRVKGALLNRQNLMLCGSPGIGKTALLLQVLASLPQALAGRCLYLPGMKDLLDLLRQLVRRLYAVKDPCLRRQLHADGVTAAAFDAWLHAQTSSHLRGALYRAFERSTYRVVLDHLPPLTQGTAKIIKELFWMRNTPVYLVPCGLNQDAITRLSRFFYWGHTERLALGPLPTPAACQLLEDCITRFGLAKLELEGFRDEVIRLSGRVPGAIVSMCSLAADPRYQYGRLLKTKLIHIDYLMSSESLAASRQNAAPYQL